ncbi:class F sortase [Actinomadura verrucosospora]|uniref:Peptidase C60, sortase A and B n=1 Tax=Actinomadura verrucosospora TaxID=46165 RepID=A0A7D3VVV4_ACTVE|nr:class F sortase [Actinomadura verrucosospora]QKG24039.1 peptidase C60, sortase A and B [Actinomadura verrucosospora]
MPESSARTAGRRRLQAAAAGALLTGLLLGGCGGGGGKAASSSSPAPAASGTPGGTTAASNVSSLAPSEPVKITVPRIGVSAPVGQIGLKPDGRIEEPPLSRPNLAGWYKEGPTPGEVGPAVILGHVDANKKAAVFFRLKELKPGDKIQVGRKDGTTATFTVERSQSVNKDAFPHQKVFGESLDHPALRLVTCGGAFDPKAGHYTENLIVYARMTAS